MLDALITEFEAVEDPRDPCRVEHRLIDVLVIAVCAVLGAAESFEDMADYGRCKHAWLERFLALPNGILSHDIGYLRGVCPGDGDGRYVIDAAGNTVAAPRGATDAFLAPWHVERGQIYVRHRCAAVAGLDV